MTWLLPILLFLALVAGLRLLTRGDDDLAAGVLLGAPDSSPAYRDRARKAGLETGAPAAPDSALVRVCGGCWMILGTSPKTVFPGQHLLLSTRETCPQCAAPSSPPDHDQTHREAPLAGGCEAPATAPARADECLPRGYLTGSEV